METWKCGGFSACGGARREPIVPGVELRNRALMTHFGVRNWPPVWSWIGGPARIDAGGEIGILREVHPSSDYPMSKFFIIVSHGRYEFMACLAFDDPAFAGQMFALFLEHRGRTIKEIGDLDLSFML